MASAEVRLYFAYMSHLFFYTRFLFLLVAIPAFSQKKWDGGGGDNLWNNALNWADDQEPADGDAVVLDNSVVSGSYTVQLPAGTSAVTVKSIIILPSAGNNIELILPSTNTVVPALIITGPGYGLDIGNGGIFRNASGASSGTPASIADSIRIRNGGRYVHNTERAHASNVQVLSAAPGTEEGIMEFDVPDVSSTISLSGRTFGRLILKAATVLGGALKYTAAGTNGVHIRSDLEIDAGVTCGLNFSDTIIVDGNFLNAGTLDLGNTARSVVLAIKKDIVQTTAGVITETGTGTQQILLNGNTPQKINIPGDILNNVELKINAADVSLMSPLTINYRLILKKGIVNTSSDAVLTIGSACTTDIDTLSNASFINGPLRKKGMNNDDFVFPVGKGAAMRWLALKNSSGDVTVEYFNSDPYQISNAVGYGLDHVSHVEYWNISGSGTANSVKLSFADPRSGGVTNLADLRVSRLINSKWENLGNVGTEGSAGGNGWVSSLSAGGFSAGNNYFALASATGQENPLPLSDIVLKAGKTNDLVRFDWSIPPDNDLHEFELQQSERPENFVTVWTERSYPHVSDYSHSYFLRDKAVTTFRIKATSEKGDTYFSNLVPVRPFSENNYSISGQSIAGPGLMITITASSDVPMGIMIYNSGGMLVKQFNVLASKGSAAFNLDISCLPKGLYFLKGIISPGKTNVFRFIRM